MLETLLLSFIQSMWPLALMVTIGAVVESLSPWRLENIDRLRWLHSLVLYSAGSAVSYAVLPVGWAGVAILASKNGWGLLNSVASPNWVAVVLSIMALDLTQWVCHWTLHHVPALWRLHRVHHSDETLDVSTAFRFHPTETLFRYLVQSAVILALGVPVIAIAISVLITTIFNVWEHLNAKTPSLLRPLSLFAVTPDLHRLHHSSNAYHQNGNFGTVLSVWDRLFGTYILESEINPKMAFGLGAQNKLSFDTMANLFLDPFRKG
jgi:sterol desaturase/sphingolipid hydroxylase (fatty acid hydroxylase superfamily)